MAVIDLAELYRNWRGIISAWTKNPPQDPNIYISFSDTVESRFTFIPNRALTSTEAV